MASIGGKSVGGAAQPTAGSTGVCEILVGSGATNVNVTITARQAPIFHGTVPRQVIATPLHASTTPSVNVIKKVLLEAVNSGNKKDQHLEILTL